MNVKTVSPASTTQTYANSGTQAVLENIKDVNTIPLQAVPLETEAVTSEVLKSAKDRAFELAGDAVRYDPVAIAAEYRNRPLQVWGRMLSVFWTFFSFTFSLWFDGKTGRVAKNEKRRAARLRDILAQLGPAFIKIGQALSTRPDLVPPVYLEELTTLQDQLPAFPNEVAYQFIHNCCEVTANYFEGVLCPKCNAPQDVDV